LIASGANIMDKETLIYFTNSLNARLKEIMPGTRQRLFTLADAGDHQDPMDEVDISSRRYEKEFSMQMQYRTKRLMEEIQDALVRIKSGNFGICEECGRDIEVGRLKVQPMATLCLGCKKELEAMRRLKVA
jgi:DnaK suppressor protein